VRCLREADGLPLPCAGSSGGGGCSTFLILGKFQRVKNPELVAEALGIARSRLRNQKGNGGISPNLHAVFLGGDAFCEEHGRHVSQCIPDAVSHEHRSAIHVAPPVRKECVPATVRRLVPAAAVLASEFETFNLVAHELAALRIPLIVSDVVGFAAFFNQSNAYVFSSGNAASLADALVAAAAAAASGRLRLAEGLRYADAVEPYRRLLLQMPSSGAAASSLAGTGEVVNARSLGPAQWPSSALRQLLRRDISLAEPRKNSRSSMSTAASLCGA
jgi:glycosyltransferase involved in cell wall biosynthesis